MLPIRVLAEGLDGAALEVLQVYVQFAGVSTLGKRDEIQLLWV